VRLASGAFYEVIRSLTFYEFINIENSPKVVIPAPAGIQNRKAIEKAGFPFSRERRKRGFSDFLRNHQY
jgi:hypothetical protein